MEQLSLFSDALMIQNDAIAALKELRFEECLNAINCYNELYPGNETMGQYLSIATFLKEGFSAAPAEGSRLPTCFFQLWNSLKEYCAATFPDNVFVDELKIPFFRKIVSAIEENELPGNSMLTEHIPAGYAYIQTGALDKAIRMLQTSLAATPDNARIYGYLGDAYLLRGDQTVARQLYFEACLNDPRALDWGHLQDAQLKNFLDSLSSEYGRDSSIIQAWFPSHAYIQGFFQPKRIRLREEFKTFTESYLQLEKKYASASSPFLAAQLFLKGIVLCDNEPSLRLVKGIDFIEIRRAMQAADATLFSSYLKAIGRRR